MYLITRAITDFTDDFTNFEATGSNINYENSQENSKFYSIALRTLATPECYLLTPGNIVFSKMGRLLPENIHTIFSTRPENQE